MRVGVLCALSVEALPIVDRLEERSEGSMYGFTISRGRYKGVEITVVESSVGKVNAALATQLLILREKPDLLFNVGVAGGLGRDLALGDVVCATHLLHHDVSPRQLVQFFPHCAEFSVCGPSLTRLKEELPHLHYGPVVTGEAFIQSKDQREQILSLFSPLAVEMEGASVAQTAWIHQVPFLSLRAISDFADDRAGSTYASFEREAAQAAAELFFRSLEVLSTEGRSL